MQNSQDTGNLGWFSLCSACVNLVSAYATFPLNKMNIRTKAGVLAPSNQKIFVEFKNFYRIEGIRGIYQGASLLPFAVIPVNFLQNYIYESLIHQFKRQSFFINNKSLMNLIPIISVIAVTPLACINATFSMIFSIIHSQKLSNLQAIKTTFKKDKRVFIESFKLTAINTILIMGTRQFTYEHVVKMLKRHKFSQSVNIFITSGIVGLLTGLIFQPFEVVLTLLAVGEKGKYKDNVYNIIKQEGLRSLLTKGLKFRLLISMIISITGVPMYSKLKQQFNLNLYV